MNGVQRFVMTAVSIITIILAQQLEGPDFVLLFSKVAIGAGIFCLAWVLIIDPILSDIADKGKKG